MLQRKKGTNPCGFTPEPKFWVKSFRNLPILVDPALLNSSCRVCRWKGVCRSGPGAVGDQQGKVSRLISIPCSARFWGFSSICSDGHLQETGCDSGRLHPRLACDWYRSPASQPLWEWRLAKCVITQGLLLYKT